MRLETPTSGSELTTQAVAMLESRHKMVPPAFVPVLFGRVPAEDLSPYSSPALADLAAAAYGHLGVATVEGRRYSPPRSRSRARRARAVTLRCSRSSTTTCRSCSIRPSPRSSTKVMSRSLSPTRSWRSNGTRPGTSCASSARRSRPVCPRRPGSDAKASFTSTSRGSTIAASRQRLIEALARVHEDVALAVHDFPAMRAQVARHRRKLPPASAARFPATRSTKRWPFSIGSSRDNFTFLGICANTACHRATPPPIRSRASGLGPLARSVRASAATRPRTGRDDAGNPGLPGSAEGAHHHQSQREIARPPPGASRLCGRQAVRRTRPPERRIAHRRPVHRERLHQHHARGSLPAAQGREGDRPRGIRPVELCGTRIAQRAGELSARRTVSDRREYPLRLRARHHESVGASAHPRAGPRRRVRPLRVGARVRAQGPLRHAGARRRIGEFLAGIYEGRLSAAYPAYPEGPLARTHYIIGRDEGKTPHVVARDAREAASPPSCAPGRRPARRARCQHRRHREPVRSPHAMPTRSAPPIARPSAPTQAIVDVGILEQLSEARPRAVDLLPPRRRRRDPRPPEGLLAQGRRYRSRSACRFWKTSASASSTSEPTASPPRATPARTGSGCTT